MMTPLESVYKAIQAFLVRNLKKQKEGISKALIVVPSYIRLLLGIQTAQAYIFIFRPLKIQIGHIWILVSSDSHCEK